LRTATGRWFQRRQPRLKILSRPGVIWS